MIKADKGNMEINGSVMILLAELSSIILTFREKDIASDEMIKECIDLAFKGQEQRHKEAKEIAKKMSAEQLKLIFKRYMEE